ncbi:hypothetical protein D3C86_2094290 [compost metagenome]
MQGTNSANSRIIKKHINTTIGFNCPIDHGFNGFCICDIRLQKEGLTAIRLNLGSRFFAFGHIQIIDDNLGSFLTKQQGSTFSDT